MEVRPGKKRTLVFCTAFTSPAGDTFNSWNMRYRIWVDSIQRSDIAADQILLIDDGSETLPDWKDTKIIHEGEKFACEANIVFYHFNQRLGRNAVSDFPGWVRSFFFAAQYARVNGFTRLVHIESDAFLISQRMQDYANSINDGWVTLWCPRHDRPESGIQIIAGSGLQTFNTWAQKPYQAFKGLVIEKTLPFTHVERRFQGDRYGEALDFVPRTAEWCMQARPTGSMPITSYYWWLPWIGALAGTAEFSEPESIKIDATNRNHSGTYYLQFLWSVDKLLGPKNYLEIGTNAGQSLARISCDAVCIDPNFVINSNVLGRRRNTHFFQGTSEDFFRTQDVARHFPNGIDLAFLDGLHLVEALLDDFINVEKHSNGNTVVVMHDCLPLNARMAERERRHGNDDEDPGIRDFWTGDVWKVVLILQKYRPDLKISFVNCEPTGLVICTGLDSENDRLTKDFDSIIGEFSALELSANRFADLWQAFPMFDAKQLTTGEYVMRRAFFHPM